DAMSTQRCTVIVAFYVEGGEFRRDKVQVGPIAGAPCPGEKVDLAPVRHHGFEREGLTGSEQCVTKKVRQRRCNIAVANGRGSRQLRALHSNCIQEWMIC